MPAPSSHTDRDTPVDVIANRVSGILDQVITRRAAAPDLEPTARGRRVSRVPAVRPATDVSRDIQLVGTGQPRAWRDYATMGEGARSPQRAINTPERMQGLVCDWGHYSFPLELV